MDYDDEFDTILELTAQLQLQDIEEWRDAQKGKGRVGYLSELELSMNAIEAQHKATLRSISDHRIAQGAQRAATDDVGILEAIAAMEERERNDRQLALRLSADPNLQIPSSPSPPPPASPPTPASASSSRSGLGYSFFDSPSTSTTGSSPARIIPAFAGLSLQGASSIARQVIFSSHSRSSRLSSFLPSILTLPAGNDTVTRAYKAPCGCFYDRDCLTELFDKATVDESLFPPRCCNQQISFQVIRSILSPQLVRKFEQKAEEFKTTNRLYCHSPTCSAFLGPAAGNERDKANKQWGPAMRPTSPAPPTQPPNKFSRSVDKKAGSRVLAVTTWSNSL
ncbi:E3 ubiquitin-protein ligase [Ceratobasidium sp. AG-Ba]|nr:E3 ubiquitin-protein ligase [Ceratobasidium sp. AG-Ba]